MSLSLRARARVLAWIVPVRPIRCREDALTRVYASIDSTHRRRKAA